MNVQLEDLKYGFSELLIKNFGKELAKGDTAAIEEIIEGILTNQNQTVSDDIAKEFPNIRSFQQFLIGYFNEIGFKFKLNSKYFRYYIPHDGPGAKKNACLYEIKLSPEYIDSLLPYQFYEWVGLKEVILPDNISEIPYMCFAGCLNLEKVKFSSQLKNIGHGAFHFCRSLTEIELPEGLSVVEVEAFKLCVNLKTVKLPHSLTSIDNFAFPGNRSDRDKFENKEIQVYYNGTIEEGDKISKGHSSIGYPEPIGLPEVICKDGTGGTNLF